MGGSSFPWILWSLFVFCEYKNFHVFRPE
uniref:Uncharacterized protein n=1 Tax=Rhizophora mucronata TaxID=61149 RepID=A0A2P2PC48_RHIMU